MTKSANDITKKLKNYYLGQSKLIDSDQGYSREIISEEEYDIESLKNEGLSLIASLRRKYEPVQQVKISWDFILRKLIQSGVPRKLIEEKVIPVSLLEKLSDSNASDSIHLAIHYLSEVFGFEPENLLRSQSLYLSAIPSQLAYFKKATNANLNQIRAYSHYAQFIAKASSKACHNLPYKDYPGDIEEFRDILFEKHGGIDLEGLLDTVWDLGICVIPLTDSGVFHGASWNIEGRHVIILKQKTDSHAKWIFDLLHELYHVFVHLDEDNTSVIEEIELSPVASNDSEEEREANTFANRVIFDSNAENLAKECVRRAENQTPKLKQAVIDTAEENGVRVDFLANYLAFRLQHDGRSNWWGVANGLQVNDPNPIEITREFLTQKLDFKILNQVESNTLTMAIN